MAEQLYIHGYRLLQPLQNRDAGFSRWTIAERGVESLAQRSAENVGVGKSCFRQCAVPVAGSARGGAGGEIRTRVPAEIGVGARTQSAAAVEHAEHRRVCAERARKTVLTAGGRHALLNEQHRVERAVKRAVEILCRHGQIELQMALRICS